MTLIILRLAIFRQIWVDVVCNVIGKTVLLTNRNTIHNWYILPKYTCDSENVNPPLEIRNIPTGVRSMVLIIDDPDSPGWTWVHGTVWNNPLSEKISENSIPGTGGPMILDFKNTAVHVRLPVFTVIILKCMPLIIYLNYVPAQLLMNWRMQWKCILLPLAN